jgi:serine/threonine protein kinase
MLCAVKKISKEKLSENPVYNELMKDELQTLTEVTNPYIMKVHELLQDMTDIYIVTEFIKGGELKDRIIECGVFSESRAAFIIFQVLSALKYLHGKHPEGKGEGRAHRDLKLENILL